MPELQITILIAAPLAIIMFGLSLNVSIYRVKLGTAQGDPAKYPFQDANDEGLKHRMRAFGNFAEYTPLSLIMLALLELNHAPQFLIWSLGIAFVIGRISHAFGMLTNPYNPTLRIIGMTATYAILLIPSAWLLFL